MGHSFKTFEIALKLHSELGRGCGSRYARVISAEAARARL